MMMQEPARILITGASGFVGRQLMRELERAGHTGCAVARRPIESAPDGWRTFDREAILRGRVEVPKIDCVIHLEVKQSVWLPTRTESDELFRVNVGGTVQWLNWCIARQIDRFVLFSSIKAVIPESAGVTTEFAKGSSDSAYGQSKWQAEEKVRAWCADARDRVALILRPAVIYGRGNTANVAAMYAAIQNRRFFLIGPNRNVKSLVAIENVTAAVTHLLRRMISPGVEAFNLVDAESYSVREIDARLRRRFGRDGNSPTLPVPLARAAACCGDWFQRLTGGSFPVNSSQLDAFLEHAHFSADKLVATGFRHPIPPLESI